jgi:integrase
MRGSESEKSTSENGRFDSRFDTPADLAGSNQPNSAPQRIPGCLWKHKKTGGWYWTIKSVFIPPNRRSQRKFTSVPLVANGGRRPVATKNKTIAMRCQKRLWGEWKDEAAKIGPRNIEDWLGEFQQYNALHASAGQVAYNVSIVRAAFVTQQVSRCQDISDDHIQRYLAGLQTLGRSARTIQAHRNSLHKFCRFLLRKGILETNPAAMVEVASPTKTPPRFLDDVQTSKALKHINDHAPQWLFGAVCVALYAGCRLSSLMALECQHVKEGGLVVPLSKTGDYTVVPLDDPIIGPELRSVLDWVRGGRSGPQPLFPVHHARYWGELLADLTVPLPVFGELPGSRAGNQWHLLRSTWAVNAARHGGTLWQLMSLGGWKVPTTVMRYINISRAAGMARNDRPENIPFHYSAATIG